MSRMTRLVLLLGLVACADPPTGFRVEPRLAADHCGGIDPVVVRDPSVPADDALARFYQLPPVRGLDFTAHKQESIVAFQQWLGQMTQLADEAARAHPEHKASVLRHFALVMTTLEIPVDARTGKDAEAKQLAFCKQVATAAEPLTKKADAIESGR